MVTKDSSSKKLKDESFESSMCVVKRDGSRESVDLNKIARSVGKAAKGLKDVDPLRIATKTISGLYDGATTKELDKLSIHTAASLIIEEPAYSKFAARILSGYIDKEVRTQEIHAFSQCIVSMHSVGLANDRMFKYVKKHARKLNEAIDTSRDNLFEYFGLQTMYDRYLLRHPETGKVVETPQWFFMRIACALTENLADTLEMYRLFSEQEYLTSSPTLFNAGTKHEQLSSCFLLDSPQDNLSDIYKKYSDIAMLSKFSGGIGVSYSRVRSTGSKILSTNGQSNGIIPWLKVLDSSVTAVKQGSRRRGAACVYLEPWHADVESFLELRDNTGDEARRTHTLNLANWIPDLFMKRVEANEQWSLFDPRLTPDLVDLYGDAFEEAYIAYEAQNIATKVLPARDLYAKMMRTLAQTGNGWMTFKDKSNKACNQTALPQNVVHLSNLCVAPETMILTRNGHKTIGDLQDKSVDVWNGYEWSNTTVRKTGTNVGLVKVTLSNGVVLDCTPNHRFPVAEGYTGRYNMVPAKDLSEGTKLAKFALPIVEDTQLPLTEEECRLMYASGFLTGDGTYSQGIPRTSLYGNKRDLRSYLDIDGTSTIDGSDRINIYYRSAKLMSKFELPTSIPINGKLAWLAGLLDSDGTVTNNGTNQSYQIGSVNLEFLNQLRLMLTTLGIDSKVTKFRDAIEKMMPDGKGGSALYPCQDMYRLLITSGDVHALYNLGLKTRRLQVTGVKPQRTAHHFTKVVSVEDTGRISDTFCFTEPNRNLGTFNGVVTGQCTEILEINNKEEVAVCNLGSINLSRFVTDGKFDYDKLARTVNMAVRQLDRVIDLNFYPIEETKKSNNKWRPIGLGCMGLADVFFQLKLAFDSEEARKISAKIAEVIYYHALSTSNALAIEKGPCAAFADTRTARGELQFDAWGVTPTTTYNWDSLREHIQTTGLRNSLMIAIAPTATIASIVGCYECIEPQISNVWKRETISGDFLQINRYLVAELKEMGLWSDALCAQIVSAEGSIQGITGIPEDVKLRYRTAWEIPMRSLIDMAADRGAFIDQSQSLNLFIESPTIGQLSSMYMHAWKKGLKTTYYLRSRPATRIAKTTVTEKAPVTDEAALVCSLENPEACEACQ